MHDHTLIWFVKDIAEPGRDVGEESDGIPKEIGGSQHSVDLTDKLLLVMEDDSFLQRGDIQPNVLQSQGSEIERCSVDVTERHGQSIQNVVEDTARIEPATLAIGMVSSVWWTYCSSTLTRSVRMKESSRATGCRCSASKKTFD